MKIFIKNSFSDRPQKLREQSLNEFRAGKYNIVVTTDVCARGIDIKDLDHVIFILSILKFIFEFQVINYDLPLDNDYVRLENKRNFTIQNFKFKLCPPRGPHWPP